MGCSAGTWSSTSSSRRARALPSELTNESDLRLNVLVEALAHRLLSDANQLAHVARGGAAEVDNDVRVDVRDLRVAHAVPLEPALIDETPRSHPLDFLEDRPGARMELKPRVLAAAPAEVLLKNAVHCGLVTGL